MRLAKSSNAGFTLLELMVVCAIIGILAMIAYPSYLNYVAKARRADAQGALMGLANAMERHYTAQNTYVGAADASDKPTIFADEAPLDGSEKFYDLTIPTATVTGYTLRATPKNGQAGDGYLEVTSTGIRRWDKNNNGSTADAGENSWD